MRMTVIEDHFAPVRPTGWLAERLHNISNPRKWRWNQYKRAVRAIPKFSPVHGKSWTAINQRRNELIDLGVENGFRTEEQEIEFRALQNVASARVAGLQTAQLFVLNRYVRHLKSKYSRAKSSSYT